jgi:Na+-translocating ferredoxin:NAD+ oxidoreductase RnfC subunit
LKWRGADESASACARLASSARAARVSAHVKLQAQVEIFLVNAAECEPMLKVDQQLMGSRLRALCAACSTR